MPFDRTRVVTLRGRQDREHADNSATMIMALDDVAPPPSFANQFIINYASIRKICTGFRRPGVAVVAVDSIRGKVAAGLTLAAKSDRANSAIIGRHGMAELYLEADPNLSLRHLALVLHPQPDADDDLRFRLLDLRTPLSFFDEEGRRLEALVSEGPVFVRCGRYLLYLLPITGDTLDDLPDDPDDGWACIPERVYFDEADAEPDRWRRQERRRQHRRGDPRPGDDQVKRATKIQTMRGPARARQSLLAGDERPLGTLELHTAAGEQALLLGARAAREGVLIGRYDRCDGDGATVLQNERISRVHLLVVEIDGALYAVDTASTNGLYRGEGDERREVRIERLDTGTEVHLGEDLATLSWRRS